MPVGEHSMRCGHPYLHQAPEVGGQVDALEGLAETRGEPRERPVLLRWTDQGGRRTEIVPGRKVAATGFQTECTK